MKSFIKKNYMLSESDKQDDQFGHKKIASRFKDTLLSHNGASVTLLVGSQGIGKSVMLNEVQKLDKLNDWIVFDAWKYPQRSVLFDAFLELIIEQASMNFFKRFWLKREISRYDNNPIIIILNVLRDWLKTMLPLIPVLFALLGNYKVGPLESIGYGVFVGLIISFVIWIVSKDSPKRITEYENLLSRIFSYCDKDLCIVLEDIDRAGDQGLLFLEAFALQLRQRKNGKSVRVVVPISRDSFMDRYQDYVKIADYTEEFRLDQLQLNDFIDNVIDKRIVRDSNDIDLIAQMLSYAINSRGISIRIAKSMIRNANVRYGKLKGIGFEAEPLILIAIEILRSITTGSPPKTSLEATRQVGYISDNKIQEILLAHAMKIDMDGFQEYCKTHKVQHQGRRVSIDPEKRMEKDGVTQKGDITYVDVSKVGFSGQVHLNARIPNIYTNFDKF